jgi:hypothetical protein
MANINASLLILGIIFIFFFILTFTRFITMTNDISKIRKILENKKD